MPPQLNLSTFTAGAVPVVNEKGQVTMQKVKVTRYVSGRRPDYAPDEYEEDENEDEFIIEGEGESSRRRSPHRTEAKEEDIDYDNVADARLQRLRAARAEEDDEEPSTSGESIPYGRRRITEPEVISGESDLVENINLQKIQLRIEEDSDEDEEAIARRRAAVRERAQQRIKEEQDSKPQEEASESEEGSEFDDYTDSDDETGPRLKPVFIRKQDRVSLKEKEAEELRQAKLAKEAEKQVEVRKAEARRIVEAEVKREMQEDLQKKTSTLDDTTFEIPVVLDNVDPEAEYSEWKVRELTRLKRDRDERDALIQEQEEIERLRNLTEEERLRELAKNPKAVTNKTQKGKMKFLQKYYHRGVFYLDKEDEVFGRDYTAPTLEDHHDKTVLPKVMQVKNFGRAGRTKYTHLVDQDTTKFDSAWTEQTNLNMKYFAGKAAGTKQVFDRPSAKRRKPNV